MPYASISDLPDSVKDNLPKHAQEIFRAAFNSAWDEYHHDESRAFRVAWGAVEHEYEKDDKTGKWVKRSGNGSDTTRSKAGEGTSPTE